MRNVFLSQTRTMNYRVILIVSLVGRRLIDTAFSGKCHLTLTALRVMPELIGTCSSDNRLENRQDCTITLFIAVINVG